MAMRALHIANPKRRDAEVAFDATTPRREIRTVLKDGTEKQNVRVLKSTIERDEQSLAQQFGSWEEVATALVEGDPEVDMEITGKKLRRTHRLWVDNDGRIAYRVNLFRTIFNPDGSERERRDINKLPSNVNKEIPLRWSGKLFPRGEVIRQFVFTRSYQVRHINGATFDFLYAMAKELHDRDALVLLGAGEKGGDPLLLSRGGQPYRGFLEGRIEGQERYILIMHLTDIELKPPRQKKHSDEGPGAPTAQRKKSLPQQGPSEFASAPTAQRNKGASGTAPAAARKQGKKNQETRPPAGFRSTKTKTK